LGIDVTKLTITDGRKYCGPGLPQRIAVATTI
jgi:hypothetical protein